MPKALVINPNTSPAMTAEIDKTARRVFQPPWSCVVTAAPAGPASLESWTDYHLASICVLPLIERHPDTDGVVLACLGDPGLYLLKEYCEMPVIGIAEAAMSLALLLGAKFGILVAMRRAVELMDSMVRTYGLESRYAGAHPLELRVLELERDRAETLERLALAGRALRGRGAEVLLLGCAGLTTFVDELQSQMEMPVIDPVEAGCRMLQSVNAARLRTSNVGLYAVSAPQRMNNLEHVFSSQVAGILSSR